MMLDMSNVLLGCGFFFLGLQEKRRRRDEEYEEQCSYTMSIKKFQDFSRTFKDLFLNFPQSKITNRQQTFTATTCSELCLSLCFKENKSDKFC